MTVNRSDHTWSLHSPILNGHRGSLPGVTWLGRDVDHPRPSSADFMNEWSYASTPPTSFRGKGKDNLTYYLQSLIPPLHGVILE